jgi:hypothetical protein
MADGMTPNEAALQLMRLIAWSEGKNVKTDGGNARAPSRDWILWTYAQCLKTAQDPQFVKAYLEWPIPKDSPAQT